MKTIKIVIAVVLLSAVSGMCLYMLYENRTEETAAMEEGVRLPVIMYHNISEKSRLWGTYNVSPKVIEEDIKYLLNNGYKTVSCKEVIDYVNGEGELPEKPVMLTVDDGFESFYAYMYPLLKRYGCKAVISPMGECIDAFSANEDHNLDYSYLTWEELKEMSDTDLVEIGNHTYNLHSDKKGRVGCGRKRGESDESYREILEDDIGRMQGEIKQYTGKDCFIFTYPYGKISDGSKEILEDMGFKVIFTCNEKINNLNGSTGKSITLGRFNRPSGKDSSEFFGRVLKN